MIGEETCVVPDQIRRLAILERKERKAGRQGFHAEFDAFLDTIEKKTLKKDQPLGEGEYRVHVTYTMPSDKKMLKREFSKNSVSHLFTNNQEWRNHSSCAKIDQTPGERIMLIKHFGGATESRVNIAKMKKLGYRPATHLEAYAFAKANPELQRSFNIIALGSFTMYNGSRCVAELCSYSRRRVFRTNHCGCSSLWAATSRFLFVRT